MKKIKIVIITCCKTGYASRAIPVLVDSKKVIIKKVIFAKNFTKQTKKYYLKKISKILKIGFLGALNGIRIRHWFEDTNSENIFNVCSKFNIEITETGFLNSNNTVKEVLSCDPDIGLSLGNSYISEKIFSIPKFGFLNIHSEILPEYQNGQSIIWPIYNSDITTGFTIHKVEKKIDQGNILFQEEYPIIFYKSLSKTVKKNLEIAFDKAPLALKKVCENIEYFLKNSTTQLNGNYYTTPSISQFIIMVKNNKSLHKKYLKFK